MELAHLVDPPVVNDPATVVSRTMCEGIENNYFNEENYVIRVSEKYPFQFRVPVRNSGSRSFQNELHSAIVNKYPAKQSTYSWKMEVHSERPDIVMVYDDMFPSRITSIILYMNSDIDMDIHVRCMLHLDHKGKKIFEEMINCFIGPRRTKNLLPRAIKILGPSPIKISGFIEVNIHEIDKLDNYSIESLSKEHHKLTDDYNAMFNDKAHCDVIVKAKGTEIGVHQCILAARSPVFAAMFEHEMREKDTKCIEIEDFDAIVMNAFLLFIYTGRTPTFNCELAVELLKVAGKYAVDDLKSLCELYLVAAVDDTNVFSMLLLADMYNSFFLKQTALNFIYKNQSACMKKENLAFLESRPDLLMMIMSSVADFNSRKKQS